MSITVSNIGSFPIQLAQNYNDTGWTVSGLNAVHQSCNAGFIINQGLALTIGQLYQVQYTISGYSSGYVNSVLGTANGNQNSSNGGFIDNIVANGTQFSFFSNGDLTISNVSVIIVNTTSNFQTLAFNETNNRWTSFYSFDPEMMVDYNQNLFTFKGGQLYIHEKGIYNNFYGVQFSSQVKIVANGKDIGTDNKIFFTLKVDSEGIWYAPTIYVPGSDQYPYGQTSALLSAQMKLKEGNYWADFLRDMTDPAFQTQLQAIFNGRQLRGQTIVITLQSDSTTFTKINGSYVYYVVSERNS